MVMANFIVGCPHGYTTMPPPESPAKSLPPPLLNSISPHPDSRTSISRFYLLVLGRSRKQVYQMPLCALAIHDLGMCEQEVSREIKAQGALSSIRTWLASRRSPSANNPAPSSASYIGTDGAVECARLRVANDGQLAKPRCQVLLPLLLQNGISGDNHYERRRVLAVDAEKGCTGMQELLFIKPRREPQSKCCQHSHPTAPASPVEPALQPLPPVI